MKRHARAASAGSTSSWGNGLGSIRRAFATRGFSGDADGSGAPSTRRLAFSLTALVTALALLLSAGPAGAAKLHPFLETFGSAATPSFGSVSALAVDQSNGDLLVIDSSAGTVSRYNPDGTPANFSTLGTNVIDGEGPGDGTPHGGFNFGSGNEVQVAVDNSGTATNGNIYVTQSGRLLVDIFSSAGAYLGQLTAAGATPFGEACGVAVDSTGAVYVGDYSGGVHKFVPAANPPVNADKTATFPGVSGPCTVSAGAGASAGSIFVTSYGGPVSRLSSSTGEVKYVVSPAATTTSVDPATGHVYVAKGSEVIEYDATGASATVVAPTLEVGSTVQGVAVGGSGIYVNRASTANISVYGKVAVTVPSVTIDAASSVTGSAATLNGTVNPDGEAVTQCKFEYGKTTAYGNTAPCAESAAEIGLGTNPVHVHVDVSGLVAFTTYHFRLAGVNANGTVNGEDETFQTARPDPVLAATDGSSEGLTEQLRTLEGRVNPKGGEITECRFLYGTTAEYGQSAPCEQTATQIGFGTGDVAVTATTEPLEPNTTYHFRLRATNAGGTSQGKDRTFTTGSAPVDSCDNADIRATQGIEVMLLPDCMALEQVSPATKANQGARQPETVSADGRRVLFNSVATLGNCPRVGGLSGDSFISVRDQSSGWETECVNPPATEGFGSSLDSPQFSFTPDLSSWLQLAFTPGGRRVFQEGLGISPTAISTPVVNLTDFSVGGEFTSVLGVSSDHSHVYFRSQGTFNGSYIPGDTLPEGPGADYNLYSANLDPEGHPSLELFSRDRDGKAWGANCGASLSSDQGAISFDGSRVYFSTRPAQSPTGNCTEANKKRIMVREETPAGPKIEEVISSECDRVSPPCSPIDGDDIYQGASVDQTRIYFTTTRQLADSDEDGTAASCSNSAAVIGCDLYLYDSSEPAGERLIDVSGGGPGAATPGIGASVRGSNIVISRDGSHVYFVARTVLTNDANPEGNVAQNAKDNLYLYSYPQGDLSFVGTLESGEGGGSYFAAPRTGTDADGNEIGGDGHILLFDSTAPLGSDDTDASKDIYRYDSDSNTLERVSQAAPGGSDNGPFNPIHTFSGGVGTDYAERGRWVSEDGRTVVFTSREALLPGDTNGVEDSYLWRDGQLFHLPGSSRSSGNARQIVPVLSHDGSTIAYHSTKRLLPSDGDSVEDVYVLRSGGGFRIPVRSVCEGEACQGAPSTLSGEIGAGTGSFAGVGNARTPGSSPSRRCPKGKHTVRRKGKTRCVSKPAHKKQDAKKRISAKQGGQK